MRRIKSMPVSFLLTFFLVFLALPAIASENFTLEGAVKDINGKPVAGAAIYLFRTANVKRPADFISQNTGDDGKYSLTLAVGKFWAIAVYRLSDARFGPLAMGDKHSGEAIVVEFEGSSNKTVDFTVRDLREAARLNRKKSDTLLKISGRILRENKKPAAMAYVMADIRPKVTNLPQYFSAWTGADGTFAMYLPHGKFYLGAETGFPPDNDYLLEDVIVLEKDIAGLEIIIKEKKP